MGQFRIEIVAVGGHGCTRQAGDGQEVYGCRGMYCPDCVTRQFVDRLQKELNCTVESAVLIHWPGHAAEVRDDLMTRKRTGSFPK